MFKSTLLLICAAITTVSVAQLTGSGKAYHFDNPSESVVIPHNPSLSSPNITIEAWIKADSWSTNIWENVIVSKDGWQTGNEGYTLRAGANGSLSFTFAGNGVWREVTSTPVMSVNKWYHVASTYDGNNLRIYINGKLQNTVAYTGSIDPSGYDLAIGKITFIGGGNRNFNGTIDEVKIWNTALPESSLQNFMCKKTNNSHPEYANLMGYWNLDATGAVQDLSVNNNTGTNNGATHKKSGAPIGDESVYIYDSNVNINLNWTGAENDNIQLESTDNFNTVHLFRIDGTTNSPLVFGVNNVEETHHYGFYADANTSYSIDATYNYGTNSLINGNEQYSNIAGAKDGGEPFIANENWTLNQAETKFTKTFTDRNQFILATICPTVSFNLAGTIYDLCDGDTLQLSSTGSSTNVTWFFNNQPLAGVTNNQFAAITAGSYYLTGNEGICTDTSNTINLSFNEAPTVEFGELSSQYCLYDDAETVLNNSPIGGVFAGPGFTGSIFNPETAGVGTHNLTYSYTDNSTGCSNSDTISVQIFQTPPTHSIFETNTQLCISFPVIGENYQWFLDNNAITGANTECYTPTENGTYKVKTTNENNCSSFSDSYALNNLSVKETELKLFEVFPNPVSNQLFIQGNANSKAYTYTISNSLGQTVIVGESEKQNTVIDFSSLNQGIYWIEINNETTSKTYKVIKK